MIFYLNKTWEPQFKKSKCANRRLLCWGANMVANKHSPLFVYRSDGSLFKFLYPNYISSSVKWLWTYLEGLLKNV